AERPRDATTATSAIANRTREESTAVGRELINPEPMFRGESGLFYGQIHVFFRQNRAQILITPVNSVGGAGASFGASCFFVGAWRFFVRASCFFVRHGVFFSEPHQVKLRTPL